MTLTREQIEELREYWNAIHKFGPKHDKINALCTMALNWLAIQPKQEQWTYGHCFEKQKPGGCQLHNLHCQYPDCDRKPLTSLPEPKI